MRWPKPTNVDMSSRIACYDIRKLGKQLLSMGMLVILDSFLNRITRNRRLGRNTWTYIDEIYLLFQHEYSANFLFTLWKRVRKYHQPARPLFFPKPVICFYRNDCRRHGRKAIPLACRYYVS